jgi:glycosyltransferase involved in cell wall biosynthesis
MSPGREQQLSYCLKQLSRQTHAPFEVIIADDGSESGSAIAKSFEADLQLKYLHRSNDRCVSRSRNWGATAAQGEILVFLDADVLLNPAGLAAYSAYLGFRQQDLLYGYVGYDKTQEAPSLWWPEISVNWWDTRYLLKKTGLQPDPKLFHSAYEFAWAGNFAIYRESFKQLGGFDEAFVGWGGEDLAFAEAAVKKGREVHFLVDAWAEHQRHGMNEPFHQLPETERGKEYLFRPHPTMPYAVRCQASQEALQELNAAISAHYQPQTVFKASQAQDG